MRTSHVARSYGRRWLAAGALCWLSLSAHAAKSFPDFMSTVRGNATTITAGTDGTLLAVKAPGTLVAGSGWTLATATGNKYGVQAGTAGAVNVGSDAIVEVGAKAVAVRTVGSISKADIAGAVVGCVAGTLVGCVTSVGIPLALAYFSVSGARVSPTGDLEMKDPWSCTAAPCYFWRSQVWGTGNFTSYVPSPQTACEDGWPSYKTWQQNGNGYTFTGGVTAELKPPSTLANPAYQCRGQRVSPAASITFDLVRGSSRALDSPTWNPTTPQAVIDALTGGATVPPPPIIPELEKAGVDWTGQGGKLKSPTVTGPSSVTGPSVVTTNPDGSTTTKTTTTPLTYSGPTVTAGPTTETTIARNPSGVTTGTTTTVTSPGTEEVKPPTTGTGTTTPQPDPPTQCDKFPDTLGCAELDIPDGEIPKETKTLTYAAESPFGGGSCPADRVFTSVMTARTYKAWDFAQTCSYIASYVRPLVLLLATFAAFLIIMPGKVET